MKIRRFSVENFRCWKKVSFQLASPQGLMIFWGQNGSGKSSLLEACQIALGMPVKRNPPKGQSYRIELEVELSDGRIATILKTTQEHVTKLGNHTFYGPPRVSSHFKEELNPFCFDSWRVPERQESVNMTLGGSRQLEKKANNALVRLQSYAINLMGLGNVTGDGSDKTATSDFFSRLATAWKLFYPNRDCSFAVRTAASAWKGDAGRNDVSEGLNLFLEDANKKSSIPVNELSSGEIEVLGMLGALMIESRPYDIVFIDEPELHLNPIWYGVLTKALQTVSPKTQFVIGTNAVDIWREAYSDERIALKPNGEGVELEVDE